jgi:hypothetical protein
MKLADDLKISGEHMTSIQTIDSYFEKHRVNEMFNEMLTNILQERPVDAVLGVKVEGATGVAPNAAKLPTACAIVTGAPSIEAASVVSMDSHPSGPSTSDT